MRGKKKNGGKRENAARIDGPEGSPALRTARVRKKLGEGSVFAIRGKTTDGRQRGRKKKKGRRFSSSGRRRSGRAKKKDHGRSALGAFSATSGAARRKARLRQFYSATEKSASPARVSLDVGSDHQRRKDRFQEPRLLPWLREGVACAALLMSGERQLARVGIEEWTRTLRLVRRSVLRGEHRMLLLERREKTHLRGLPAEEKTTRPPLVLVTKTEGRGDGSPRPACCLRR